MVYCISHLPGGVPRYSNSLEDISSAWLFRMILPFGGCTLPSGCFLRMGIKLKDVWGWNLPAGGVDHGLFCFFFYTPAEGRKEGELF